MEFIRLWRAPLIDVFLAYDEQPGPSTDDYTCPPEDQGSGLVSLRRITLQRPIFKNHTRAVRLPMPKIPYIYVTL